MEKIAFYGTRGSCTLTSSQYSEFGGATTCILLNFDNTHIMVDCGSGISNATEDLKNIDELFLFISHRHLDHVCGIPILLTLFQNKKLHIYGKSFNGITIKDAISNIMNKSFWPIRIDKFKNIDFNEINDDDISINDVVIKNMDSNHPGGCSLYRFDYKYDCIVTAFDFCHLNGYEEKLINFAKGCKTLIYDGFLDKDELILKEKWGHSTADDGARIGKILNCNKVYITHHGLNDDEQLNIKENNIQKEYPNVIFARSGLKKDNLKKIVEIGTMLSLEKDNDVLLTKIVENAMDITNADGGTLYLLENNNLEFKVLINHSKNTKLIRKDYPLYIPPVSIDGKNVCATSAREKKIINIENCYLDKNYDFSGSLKYDKLNNYKTQSVLVIPMKNEYDDIIGILQLINAKNKNDEIISFDKNDEDILLALANQASMAIVNNDYSLKINELLYGFVKVMSVEIDERTPYNANHTRNMVRFAEKFFDYENATLGIYNVDDKKRREILMSIWLHDIGKILTPIDIMNKDSRLGSYLNDVESRFERRFLLLKLSLANNEISKEEYDALENERKEQLEFINFINKVGFLSDDLKAKLDILATKTYKELDGSLKPVITKVEQYQLSIVKGTLTKEERKIMENHVSLTQKFLSQLNFPKYYDNIPKYAGNHHEFLNGSGYPNHLDASSLDWPCRLITVCDIFEALIAKDRPYKKPFPIDKAISILYEMANEGKLDKSVIDEFVNSKAWEN